MHADKRQPTLDCVGWTACGSERAAVNVRRFSKRSRLHEPGSDFQKSGIHRCKDLKRLTTHLSQKIWQKVTLISESGRMSYPPGPIAQP